jgi:zinc-ribbon domain
VTTGGGTCPRCGARVEPGQEYCLECGLRLPGGGLSGAVGSAWQRRIGRSVPTSIWSVLGVLAVATAMTGVAIFISTGGDDQSANVEVATGPQSISTPTTAPATTETTASTETATTAATTQPPPPRPQIVDWPPSQDGYTIVIASMPTTGGRAVAIRKAREALAARLPNVGVLDSGEFSSLHPGYYVVFSGIYPDQRGALGGIGRVQNLYPAAYIRQISH